VLAPTGLTRGLAAAVAALGFALCAAGGAAASSFAVEPSTFTLVLPTRNATITLTNLSDQPVRLRVSGQAWSEDDAGTFALTPTSALIVFPQLFTIPPKGVQRVRAAVVAPPSSVEQAFRIVIEDLPPLDQTIRATPGTNITIRTRFTLPIYVEPLSRAPAGRLENVGAHDGRLTFTVQNLGNTHLAGDTMSVAGRDGKGKVLFADTIDRWHVLAGARRIYTLGVDKAVCASLRSVTISSPAASMLPAQTVDVASCS
jgi:fimbrial chaperone protein